MDCLFCMKRKMKRDRTFESTKRCSSLDAEASIHRDALICNDNRILRLCKSGLVANNCKYHVSCRLKYHDQACRELRSLVQQETLTDQQQQPQPSIPEQHHQLPAFYPTWSEFKNFHHFLEKMIDCGAQETGLVKVVPPPEFKHHVNYNSQIGEMIIPNPVQQAYSRLENGVFQFSGIKSIKEIKVKELKRMSEEQKFATPVLDNDDEIARKYWRTLIYLQPVYGADVTASLFDDSLAEWNLRKLGSILDYTEEYIDGVHTPFLYFGMWKTSFGWHTEDYDLHSINFLHFGEPKRWYSIAPKYRDLFEKLVAQKFKDKCPNFIRHKQVIISPDILKANNIPYTTMVQRPGEFILAFAGSYHAGFNHGFNCAEAINFATPSWVKFGEQATRCVCGPDTVFIDMAKFYSNWRNAGYPSSKK